MPNDPLQERPPLPIRPPLHCRSGVLVWGGLPHNKWLTMFLKRDDWETSSSFKKHL
jgi:hypothetical protein